MDFQPIYDGVIGRLTQNLPAHLTYHSVKHTEYVVEKAIYIAEKEKLPETELFLLKVAALYHDSGFLFGPANHEERGCELVWTELPEKGFSEPELIEVCEMIRATKIPQEPQSHAARILADADLEYLGTSHFQRVSELLYEELRHFNPSFTREEWNETQRNFISNHHYHTAYCRRYKAGRKAKNLASI